jgi:type III pantothenate kinase
MNLTIDIGNTFTKFSIFKEDNIISSFKFNELTVNQLISLNKNYPGLEKAILSTVKKYSPELKKYLFQNFKKFIELDNNTPVPVENCYESKNTLGNDRIAAAVGANYLYPDTNLLLIDAGTAVTYDFVNENNQYMGGKISPGLEMRFRALHQFTGKLPLIQKGDINKLYGITTEESIRAGVENGLIYETDKTIDSFKEFYRNLKVIITGGDAIFFDKKLKNSFFVNFNLTALGLNRILIYNGEI